MKRQTAPLGLAKYRVLPVIGGIVAILSTVLPPLQSDAGLQPHIEKSGEGVVRRLSMGVGKSVIVNLPKAASEIFVGNPKVANAVVRSARKLYIIGIADGQTTVFAMDSAGRQIAALEISIGRDVGELQQILNAALPNSSIVTRTINDTIILSGAVNSAEEAQRATDIAQGFVKQTSQAGSAAQNLVVNSLVIRGRDQVMLKVSVAEIQRNVAKQLGLTSSTWGAFTQYNPFGIAGSIATNPATNLATSLTVHNPANTISATLQAFERYGVSRILAEPTVTAISGENAKFTVGGEVPIPSAPVCTTNGTVTNCSPGGVTYQPYGVTLNFAPVVLSAGRILLHIATEVTELDYQTAVTIQSVTVPGLRTRKNETTVEIPSGGSIASAGFLQTISTQVINGLPGLMDLPILGTLFRSRDYQRNETELMIIVTPYLMKATATNRLPKPDDGFADSSDPQAWLLGRVNRLYASPNNPEALKNFKGRVGFIQD
ncbi:type II and III secretion system protein family protein [Methylovirgula sp. HY1]|uniref:type II and III secretion system protein family protein n=1 Tax=Methylovirgula sp. HY1 TaxID=2822761 RepID=UPI001C5A627B|nr:type II and III secretion system protein family protein [Methylovirgula sp. HY1]QXX75740.1 Type II secretion system protein D [Methylovirgula sp. HY1]